FSRGPTIIVTLACVIWITPLRSHMTSALQSVYKTLHIEGDYFAGCPESSETVFLVGDAGAMTHGVASALERAVRGAKRPPALIYLGDNVYPVGLPAAVDTPEWRRANTNLMKQIVPFRTLTNQIFFTPGNHDWENHSPDGWNAIKRETAFIEGTLGAGRLVPANGCPGPTKIQLFPGLQLIALDSSWWLHDHAKPTRSEDGCEVFSENGVVSALDVMLANTPLGVESMLILHHPLLPTSSDHAHNKCPYSPDCPTYVSMRDKLSAVLAKHRPLICASGHNHALQVHREQGGCRTYVVSGGGSTVYAAKQPTGAEFAEASLGFMVLHRHADRDWKLDVVGVGADDSALPLNSRLIYSTSVK
ncbi:MAG: hypothetical protein RL326_152, partial [Pseudomonadota bacterium]